MIKQMLGWFALAGGTILVLFSLFANTETIERYKAEADASSWRPYQSDPFGNHPRVSYFVSGLVVAVIGTWLLELTLPRPMLAFELLGVTCFAIALYRWVHTWRFFGVFHVRHVLVTTYHAWHSRRRTLFLAGCLSLLIVATQVVAPDVLPLFPPLFLIGLALVALTGCVLPPGVIFLAASGADSEQVAKGLKRACWPLRVVDLLNPSSLSFNERTNKNWKVAVRDYIFISPIVVADLRKLQQSDPLVFELTTSAVELSKKPLVVVRNQAQLHEYPGLEATAVSEEELWPMVWRLLRSRHMGSLALAPAPGSAITNSLLPSGCVRYEIREGGLAFELPSAWKEERLLGSFAASGGLLALSSAVLGATINVSVGLLYDPRFQDVRVRAEEARRVFKHLDNCVIQHEPLAGCDNCVRSQWIEPHGGPGGLISLVRRDRECVIQWQARRGSTDWLETFLQTLRWDGKRAHEGVYAPPVTDTRSGNQRNTMLARVYQLNQAITGAISVGDWVTARQHMNSLGEVVQQLGVLGEDEVVKAVAEALGDSAQSFELNRFPEAKALSEAAIEALHNIGTPALGWIARGVEDPRPAVRRAFQRALNRVSDGNR